MLVAAGLSCNCFTVTVIELQTKTAVAAKMREGPDHTGNFSATARRKRQLELNVLHILSYLLFPLLYLVLPLLY